MKSTKEDRLVSEQQFERRRHARARVELDVWVSSTDDPPDFRKTQVLDLSLMGMAISEPEIGVSQGQTVRLCFALEGAECPWRRLILGRVVHRSRDSVGVEFEMLGVEILTVINGLLDKAKYF
jgi:hypothetical protein